MSEPISHEASSGNVFADLGLAEPEERLAKASLARKIAQIIGKRHLTQGEAAKLLKLDQPKVSAILSGRLSGFSLERLLLLLILLDRDVEIRIKKKPRTREHASLVVKCA
jgi:predicted XRE-type DNA-binding protein